MLGGRIGSSLGVRAGSLALGWLALCWLASGCNDLGEFRTDANTRYVGQVNGSDSDQGKGSFIREGFASHTELSLAFDPDAAARFVADAGAHGAVAPGTIDTYVCSDAEDQCSSRHRSVAEFDHADLEPITNLTHDALSQYDFPGGGRLRNYMFFARTRPGDDGMPSRAATVFISLMDNGRIEVRVIAPSVLSDDGETALAPALFGVFVLKRTMQ
jgi:hypothetical protein